MIYYHSDDYAFHRAHAERILDCYYHGALNSVSIFPNCGCLEEIIPLLPEGVSKRIHLNFCEGPCCADKEKIPLLVDERGFFNRSFVQMLLLSLVRPRALKEQLLIESLAQIRTACALLPQEYRLRLDSHRHYHMIPTVFEAVYSAAMQTGRDVEDVRIARDPWGIYLCHPQLLRYTRPINIIKNLLLSLLYLFDRRIYCKWQQPKRMVFFGMMCTGEMTWDRVRVLLPYYRKIAMNRYENLELMFHPGILRVGDPGLDDVSAHMRFYCSTNRNKERKTLIRMKEWIELGLIKE